MDSRPSMHDRPATRHDFGEVWRLIHPGHAKVGPSPAVDDLDVAAGLLFVRWNDRTGRRLVSRPNEAPRAVVTTHQFASSSDAFVHLTPRVADLLWDEGLVDGDRQRWEGRLSARGRVHVAHAFECGAMDAFAAGAVLDLAEGNVRWPA